MKTGEVEKNLDAIRHLLDKIQEETKEDSRWSAWTTEEEGRLRNEYSVACQIIAMIHGRTRNAIDTRIRVILHGKSMGI